MLDHTKYLEICYEECKASESEGGIPIGCCIVDTETGEVVQRGHNMRCQWGDSTAHGETSTLRQVGRRTDWHKLTIYSSLSPCVMCCGAISLHKFRECVVCEEENFRGPGEEMLPQYGVTFTLADQSLPIVAKQKELFRAWRDSHPELWNEDIAVPEE